MNDETYKDFFTDNQVLLQIISKFVGENYDLKVENEKLKSQLIELMP